MNSLSLDYKLYQIRDHIHFVQYYIPTPNLVPGIL